MIVICKLLYKYETNKETKTMKYAQIQQLARALKNQGVIDKSFSLTQKADILIAEIKENITKVDRKNISPELAAILLDFTILAINYKPEAAKTPQKTTKKAAKSTKKTEAKEKEMTQEEFNKNFVQVYLKERNRQEQEDGVLSIKASEIKEIFITKYKISKESLDKLYNNMPGKFEPIENGKKLLQLTLEQLEDGTYAVVENTTGNLAA